MVRFRELEAVLPGLAAVEGEVSDAEVVVFAAVVLPPQSDRGVRPFARDLEQIAVVPPQNLAADMERHLRRNHRVPLSALVPEALSVPVNRTVQVVVLEDLRLVLCCLPRLGSPRLRACPSTKIGSVWDAVASVAKWEDALEGIRSFSC